MGYSLYNKNKNFVEWIQHGLKIPLGNASEENFETSISYAAVRFSSALWLSIRQCNDTPAHDPSAAANPQCPSPTRSDGLSRSNYR